MTTYRRILVAHSRLVAAAASSQPPPTTYAQGIDFRATPGFVADPAGYAAETAKTANYPRTTPQGNKVGWEQAPGRTKDELPVADTRLAGCAAVANTSSGAHYRLDVPPGDYTLRLALGNQTTDPIGRQDCLLLEGEQLLAVVATDLAAFNGAFVDAMGTIWNPTKNGDWTTHNVERRLSIMSGTLRIALGVGSTNLWWTTIASLYLAAVAA